MEVGFHYSVFADDLRKQAADQGFRLKDGFRIQKYLDYLLALRMQNVFTDSMWDKVLQRFQKYVVVPNLERRPSNKVVTYPDEYLKREV